MSHHDDVENNPVKETLVAILGLVPLIVIIAGIAVFGWLRPAGQHYPAESEVVTAPAETAPATTAQ